MACSVCRQIGHKRQNCPQLRREVERAGLCPYCERRPHEVRSPIGNSIVFICRQCHDALLAVGATPTAAPLEAEA